MWLRAMLRVNLVRNVVRRALSAASPVNPGSGLTEDQLMWMDAAQKWGAAELAPFSAEWDKNSHFPIDVIKVRHLMSLLKQLVN